MRELIIAGQRIADDTPAFTIAEIGHNHQGDIETCKRLIVASWQAGFSAVKLQKRHNRTLYTRAMYDQPYTSEHAFGSTYGAHREALEFDFADYSELKTFCASLPIIFFATAFDWRSVDFLYKLGMPAIKIASGDLSNIPLLSYAVTTQLPLIISTGAADMVDVERAANAVLGRKAALLQCTAAYPAAFDQLNLRVIQTYRERFPERVIGLSAHDNGIAMAVAAYALGARMIEKHVTLDRTMKGSDHAFSLEPAGQRKLIRDLKRVYLAMGDGQKKCLPEEAPALAKMGKSIYTRHRILKGQIIEDSSLTLLSPGGGLPAWRYFDICGKRAGCDLEQGELIPAEALEWEA